MAGSQAHLDRLRSGAGAALRCVSQWSFLTLTRRQTSSWQLAGKLNAMPHNGEIGGHKQLSGGLRVRRGWDLRGDAAAVGQTPPNRIARKDDAAAVGQTPPTMLRLAARFKKRARTWQRAFPWLLVAESESDGRTSEEPKPHQNKSHKRTCNKLSWIFCSAALGGSPAGYGLPRAALVGPPECPREPKNKIKNRRLGVLSREIEFRVPCPCRA